MNFAMGKENIQVLLFSSQQSHGWSRCEEGRFRSGHIFQARLQSKNPQSNSVSSVDSKLQLVPEMCLCIMVVDFREVVKTSSGFWHMAFPHLSAQRPTSLFFLEVQTFCNCASLLEADRRVNCYLYWWQSKNQSDPTASTPEWLRRMWHTGKSLI